MQETSVQKTKKLPKKSATFGGGLLVLFWGLKYRCFLDFQDKRYRLASYLMEHIYFEAQLCSEIAILKEKSKKIKILRKAFDWWSIWDHIVSASAEIWPLTSVCTSMTIARSIFSITRFTSHVKVQYHNPPKGDRSEACLSIFIEF